MSYDDPVSADEVVRSIAAGAREGMAQVMQLGANALRAPEDSESVAEGLEWLTQQLMACAALCAARFRLIEQTIGRVWPGDAEGEQDV